MPLRLVHSRTGYYCNNIELQGIKRKWANRPVDQNSESPPRDINIIETVAITPTSVLRSFLLRRIAPCRFSDQGPSIIANYLLLIE
jgi:hypothetical protein